MHDRFENVFDVETGLGGDGDRIRCIDPDHILDLLADTLGLGRGQVHLVEDRDDLQSGIDSLINVRKRLRFHALTGIDHQQGAFAGGQAAR